MECSEVTFQGKPITVAPERRCLKFKELTELGTNKADGTHKYIEVVLSPCTVDCEMGLNDSGYEEMMQAFLFDYVATLSYIDTVSDFNNYEKPIS